MRLISCSALPVATSVSSSYVAPPHITQRSELLDGRILTRAAWRAAHCSCNAPWIMILVCIDELVWACSLLTARPVILHPPPLIHAPLPPHSSCGRREVGWKGEQLSDNGTWASHPTKYGNFHNFIKQMKTFKNQARCNSNKTTKSINAWTGLGLTMVAEVRIRGKECVSV